jgi:hypothetical protein
VTNIAPPNPLLEQAPDREAEFVRTAYGAQQSDAEISYRQHEARIVSLVFKWSWE